MPTAADDAFLRYPHSGLLIDSLPLGIVFQDLKGQIRAANPAAETILGLTLDQMRGVTSVDPAGMPSMKTAHLSRARNIPPWWHSRRASPWIAW
jgi:PAS domain-containing protein